MFKSPESKRVHRVSFEELNLPEFFSSTRIPHSHLCGLAREKVSMLHRCLFGLK